ncbi:MAG TPA: A24 family peptidase, partial [Chloroflexia bacterium]|nr:A24 family peptidase [Chloroflexia bacterium]
VAYSWKRVLWCVVLGQDRCRSDCLTFAYSLLVFILGLFAGFGINVVSTRLAANRPMLGAFNCSRSPHPLSLVQVLPVLGYISQRGVCTTCGKRLPASFPATELATGGLFLALFLFEGWGLSFAFHALYVAALLLVLVIDWKHRDIYFSVIAAGSLFALVGSLLLPGASIQSALIGAGVAGGFFLLAYLLAKLIFPHIEEPLGAGDVWLALMMGLMLGFPNVVGALLIGPLLAGLAVLLLLVLRKRKMGDFIPYGVALCAASILFLVYPGPFADALKLPNLMLLLAGIFG